MAKKTTVSVTDCQTVAFSLTEVWFALSELKREGRWDVLDDLLGRIVRDDAHARVIVNALMHDDRDIRFMDAAQEVATRIIGNHDLRF